MSNTKCFERVIFELYILNIKFKTMTTFLKNSILVIVFFTLSNCIKSYGQQTPVDLRLTGTPDLAVYPGYPLHGYMHLTFTNSSGIDMPVGQFTIQCTMPPGFIFDAIYPTNQTFYPKLPDGWSYSKIDDLTAVLTPNIVISGTFPAGNFEFFVPFQTSGPVTNGSYVSQTISSIAYPDPNPNNNRPSGTVTVANVLPVDFLSINASIKNCTTQVDWKVANQINLKQYELESSTDGINFTTGKIVPPNNQNTYSAQLPISGDSIYFYRIKAVDLDGQYKYSSITSIKANCNGKQGAFLIYPNPVLKGKSINVSSTTNESTTYRILDMAGKTIQNGKFTGNTTLLINIAGTYIIDLQSASVNTMYKLVVQ
jgi:hypothetical protein